MVAIARILTRADRGACQSAECPADGRTLQRTATLIAYDGPGQTADHRPCDTPLSLSRAGIRRDA